MAVRIYIQVTMVTTTIVFACCYGRGFIISAWNVCHEASHVVLYNTRLGTCAWECADRDSCVAVQYNRMEHSCGILTSKQSETPLATCPSLTYIRRTHIITELESCGPYKQSSVDGSCITECSLTENLQYYAEVDQLPSVGSRIKIGCKPPLTLAGDQYLHCTDSGEFNSTAPVCLLPNDTNLALQKPTWQSSAVEREFWTGVSLPVHIGDSSLAVDGNTDSNFFNDSCSHTDYREDAVKQPNGRSWWVVDLGSPFVIRTITVYNRQDCCGERFANIYIYTSTTNNLSNDELSGTLCAGDLGPFIEPVITVRCGTDDVVVGRYIKIISDKEYNTLTLCEVQVQGDAVGTI